MITTMKIPPTPAKTIQGHGFRVWYELDGLWSVSIIGDMGSAYIEVFRGSFDDAIQAMREAV